ncbi:MAG: sugar ABC transporter ATP-binding protein [Acidimicrobiales bacterium]
MSVAIPAGSVYALVGENGAGKSTLGRVFSGAVQPDAGELVLEGRPVHFSSPRDAQRAGVVAVTQELTLVPQLSVIDNVFLGIEQQRFGVLSGKLAGQRFDRLVETIGLRLLADRKVRDLGVADRQKVEILRAVGRDARVVVMDEPTAALVADEVRQLLDLVRRLARSGTTVVYVSHALEDVLEVADWVTVLRDGKVVMTGATAAETAESLATAMLGRPLDMTFPARLEPLSSARVVCEVRHLSRHPDFSSVDFSIRAGEILGLAGLVDSGATSIGRVLAGDLAPTGGEIALDGRSLRLSRPRDALRHGVSLLPESRRDQGLFMHRPIRENVTATGDALVSRLGFVQRARERRLALEKLSSFDVRMASVDAPVSTLSGGNQQKVLLGKCVFMSPKMLVALQPTRGVDVGAKAAIYRLLVELASGGTAIVLVSPEVEEVYGLAHRILVLRRGRVVAGLLPGQVSYEQVMAYVLGAAQIAQAGEL